MNPEFNEMGLLKRIEKDIVAVQSKGLTAIPIESLLRYLHDLSRELGASKHHTGVAKPSPNQPPIELISAMLQAENERNTEAFRSVIAAGQEAMKAALLINAGASVAFLAFLGNLVSKPDPGPVLIGATSALLLFVAGVLVSAVAHGTTYLAQFSWKNRSGKAGARWNRASICCVIVSYLMFGFGAFVSYKALLKAAPGTGSPPASVAKPSSP